MRGEPEKQQGLDAEYLAGMRFPYQEDIGLIEDVDLLAATPGDDINWLEDIHLLRVEGVPAVFDRYSKSFLRIYFPNPAGREDEIARKVLIKHLQSGNSYGIQLKEKHTKFAQPELGSWVPESRPAGTDWQPPAVEGGGAPLTGSGGCSRGGTRRCTRCLRYGRARWHRSSLRPIRSRAPSARSRSRR